MKTLVNIDTNILKDYHEFDKVNDNWNIGSYLNTFYDLNAAVSFAKLYFPDFVEERGCVILSLRYDNNVFEQWYNELNGNVPEVEKMCNMYELKDFFHINTGEYENSESYEKVLDDLGISLKKAWELNLEKLYPDREFEVKLFTEYESKFITLHTK